MPLVLSLRPGDDFFAGDQQVVVGEILDDRKFRVRVVSSGRVYTVSDEESTELREIRDVFLSAGDRPQVGVARVAIDAPRSIPILRGDSARNTNREAVVEKVASGSRFA